MAHGVGLAKARPPKMGGEKTKPALQHDFKTFTHSSFTNSVIYSPDIYPLRHLPT